MVSQKSLYLRDDDVTAKNTMGNPLHGIKLQEVKKLTRGLRSIIRFAVKPGSLKKDYWAQMKSY